MSHYKRPLIIRKFIEFTIWPIEALFVGIIVVFMRLLPIRVTSSVFGWLFAKIGPKTKYHQRCLSHIALAMPELDSADHEAIIKDMWAHLGRLAGEYPHIHKMGSSAFLTLHGAENLDKAGDGAIILGGHLGNWEMNMMVAAMLSRHYGLVYRPLNNPLTNWLLDMRHLRGEADTYAKGQDAARGIMNTLKKKGLVFLFVDQKYRQGIMADFMGHPASTPIGHVRIALKKKVPLIFMRCLRREGCHYDVYIEEPLYIYTDGKVTNEAVQQSAQMINDKLSAWIRQTPAQWLWPHRRWGKKED